MRELKVDGEGIVVSAKRAIRLYHAEGEVTMGSVLDPSIEVVLFLRKR